MSKYFKNNLIWSEQTKDLLGLPRPYVKTPIKAIFKKGVFFLHQRIPMPWQTKPNFRTRPISLIKENESKVYKESLCSYCGIKFIDTDFVVRWTATDVIPTENGPRVKSDIHPHHIECMKQARIFCPYMRKTQDSEFEFGLYSDLRNNVDFYLKSIGII
jgi:hypothetical protein